MRQGHPSQRWLAGIAVACSALLVVSCGDTEQPANAKETTNAPETPGSSAPAVVSERADVVLVDLDDPGEVATWTTVNDPVMGGASTSKVTFGNGGLVFSGNISLENNGGFASARGPQDPGLGRLAAGATSLRVRGQGDGKTYVFEVGIDGQPWSYIQRFTTDAGVQRTYELPIAGFQPVGMRLDPAPDAPRTLDPSLIDQVSVYILDKQQGPFELTINGIDAILGGQS
ncbi:CIA30 family protein [Mycolicibacterium vaccae]|uniref:Complex I intermediate-associated protein 30 (CIA30) n=1 Tax=Mycolicibacterium vaccae ATCC 25954 TaxID=1194972 RepID=K0UVJ2_MYCVA|nr:CIA30 family protein [Mycolicibacterium vaccae]ANI42957.1 NADH:ubiquinone oxidoreductase [Mycolicibacterium vaccae 95051]EJZ06613.1 Complex I intermediate-associated protein 30 (CIA30) [Mycolicibacterium vaccae ATCC 25954]